MVAEWKYSNLGEGMLVQVGIPTSHDGCAFSVRITDVPGGHTFKIGRDGCRMTVASMGTVPALTPGGPSTTQGCGGTSGQNSGEVYMYYHDWLWGDQKRDRVDYYVNFDYDGSIACYDSGIAYPSESSTYMCYVCTNADTLDHDHDFKIWSHTQDTFQRKSDGAYRHTLDIELDEWGDAAVDCGCWYSGSVETGVGATCPI